VLLTAALLVAAVMGVRAVRANARAEQRRAQAEELIDFMLLDLRDKLQPVGRLDLLDDVGERAMSYFGAVPESELSDEELAHRSTALHQIADVRIQLGDLEGAQQPLTESLDLARALAARDPDNPDRMFGLGQSEFWVGYALWERGDLAAARPHFEAYEAVSERLVARDPERPEWRAELSYAHSNLGSLLQAQGDLPGALDRFRRTLAIDERLTAEAEGSPEAGDRRFDLALTHNTVGVVLERLGRLDEALEHYRADLALRRGLDELDPRNRRWREFLGTSHQYLGALHLARGEVAPARRHLAPSHAIFPALVAHDPDNAAWRYKLAWSEIRLGQLERASGRPNAARAAWERAAREAEALTAVDPESFDWRLLRGVAAFQALPAPEGSGPADPADPERAREVVDLLEPQAAERPDSRRARSWLARSLLLLGDALSAAGDGEGARDAWARAAEALEPLASDGGRDHDLLVPWEAALRRLGRRDEASRVRGVLDAMGVPPHDPVPGRLPRDSTGTS
jgi:tetratricopeptide (TPR) repeat protein